MAFYNNLTAMHDEPRPGQRFVDLIIYPHSLGVTTHYYFAAFLPQ